MRLGGSKGDGLHHLNLSAVSLGQVGDVQRGGLEADTGGLAWCGAPER